MLITTKHPWLKLSHELQTLCQPLELLKITHFSYHKRDHNGYSINLSNKPKWIEDYFNLKLYQSSLFEAKPKYYLQGYEICIGDYPFAVYQHGKHYYNSVHSIIVTQPVKSGCEFYFFSTDDSTVIHYLANNMQILYHFIAYFKDKAIKLLCLADKHKIKLNNLATTSVNTHLSQLMNNPTMQFLQKANKAFYQATCIHQYYCADKNGNEKKLTDREIDCLFHLANYQTASETAKLMNLSRRTVESYLKNIQNKLLIYSKRDILKQLKLDKLFFALRS